MHAWFTSDAHCLSSQSQVYISLTHSIQTTMTTGCMHGLQVMCDIVVQYSKCICPYTQAHNTHSTDIRMHSDAQVMHSV